MVYSTCDFDSSFLIKIDRILALKICDIIKAALDFRDIYLDAKEFYQFGNHMYNFRFNFRSIWKGGQPLQIYFS